MIRIDGYPIDIAISESYNFESEVTQHPVESGADITDHIRAVPIEITLECVVSNTPIGPIAIDPTRENITGDSPLPSDEALTLLRAIRDDRRTVTVEASRGTFKNMVLSLSVPVSKETGNALRFTATFKQIKLVENKRITVRVAIPNAAGKQQFGLNAAKFISERSVIWHKRTPPGGALNGINETLYWKKSGRGGKLFHTNGTTPLTDGEVVDYRLDSAISDADASVAASHKSDERLTKDPKYLRALRLFEAEEASKSPVDPALSSSGPRTK